MLEPASSSQITPPQLAPGRIAVVDACFEVALADAGASAPPTGGGAPMSLSLGAVVTVRGRRRAGEPARSAVVTAVRKLVADGGAKSLAEPEPEPQANTWVDLLFTDGSTQQLDATQVTVQPADESLMGGEVPALLARTPLNALTLVDAVLDQPQLLLAKVNVSGVVPFDVAAEVAQEGLVARLASAGSALQVLQVEYEPEPDGFVLSLLSTLGAAVGRLAAEDELAAAQRLLLCALRMLLREQAVESQELVATAKLGMALSNGSKGVDRLHRISEPLNAMLSFLSKSKPRVIITTRPSWEKASRGGRPGGPTYSMREMQRPALCAAMLVLSSGPDALRRARSIYLGSWSGMPALSAGRARKSTPPPPPGPWKLDLVTPVKHELPTLEQQFWRDDMSESSDDSSKSEMLVTPPLAANRRPPYPTDPRDESRSRSKTVKLGEQPNKKQATTQVARD